MRNKLTAIFLFLICAPCFVVAQDLSKVRYEVLLNSAMYDSILKNDQLVNQLVISPDSLITLSNGNQFLMLGWGGIEPLGSKFSFPINSFSFTSDGLLMAIRADQLYFLNKEGILDTLIELPTEKMKICKGKEVMYLMDQQRKDSRFRFFALAKGGKYKELFISPKPVSAVVEKYDSLYVSIESGIYRYSPETNKIDLLLGLDKELKIISLAADPYHDILYFSTQNDIYAYQKGKIALVSEGIGGQLEFFGNGLVIFMPEIKSILRIVNISSSIQF